MLDVIHDGKNQRFLINVDQQECVLDYRRAGQAILEFYHTFVPPELRGRQIANKLTMFALKYAREHHLWIIPSSSYVSRFISRHSEFQDLVA